MAFGLTAGTIAAIVAATASTAGAATAGYEAHASDVHAGEAKRDQAAAIGEQENQMQQQQKQNEAQQAAAVSLARQRAVASLMPSTFGGTLGTGSSGQQGFSGKTLLGQ